METLATFAFTVLLTVFFVWRYTKKLAARSTAAGDTGAIAVSDEGPRGPRPIIDANLCIACGSCIDACPETGALLLAQGKAILANPDLCKTHGDCVGACPTGGIKLGVGGPRQTLRVPKLSDEFESNVSKLFIVGELGGAGLIKSAINEGKLAIDHIRFRLEDAGLWREGQVPAEPADGVYDVLIVGAGPGGLSASLTAHSYGLKYVTLEQGEIASTIRNYPRHKFLMAEPLHMPLIGDLYVGDSTKEALLAVWEKVVRETGVRVHTGRRVESLNRDQGFFVANVMNCLEVEFYRARYVVLALGKRGTPRRLEVPGEDLSKVAYRLIEAESYRGKDILIVGGGDSAIEAALGLAKDKRNRVTISYRGAEFSRLKERNLARLELAEQSGLLNVLRGSQIEEIGASSAQIRVAGESRAISNDYVFILIGGTSPDEFLKKTGVEIVEKVLSA